VKEGIKWKTRVRTIFVLALLLIKYSIFVSYI